MTKKPVSELRALRLDYMVAKAIGMFEKYPQMEKQERFLKSWQATNPILCCQFSGNYEHSGRLIDQYKPKMEFHAPSNEWVATVFEPQIVTTLGDSFLEAFCRAIVQSKFGDVIEVPEFFGGNHASNSN